MDRLEVEDIQMSVCSDKQTVRNKAFDRLFILFDSRSRELVQLLCDESDVSWQSMHAALHDSVKYQGVRIAQKCSDPLLRRAPDHPKALNLLLKLADENGQPISFGSILTNAFECFSDSTCRKHFADGYLSLVQNFVLKASCNLSEVKVSDWSSKSRISSLSNWFRKLQCCRLNISELFSYLVELYDENQIKKPKLIECMTLAIQIGTKYKLLADDLHQYDAHILKILKEENDKRENVYILLREFLLSVSRKEWLIITFDC